MPPSDTLRHMGPSARHLIAERRFRELLEANGLDAPDRVEYDLEEMVFFWEEQKLAVVVELGDVPVPADSR
jgi:hypothetical protein